MAQPPAPRREGVSGLPGGLSGLTGGPAARSEPGLLNVMVVTPTALQPHVPTSIAQLLRTLSDKGRVLPAWRHVGALQNVCEQAAWMCMAVSIHTYAVACMHALASFACKKHCAEGTPVACIPGHSFVCEATANFIQDNQFQYCQHVRDRSLSRDTAKCRQT